MSFLGNPVLKPFLLVDSIFMIFFFKLAFFLGRQHFPYFFFKNCFSLLNSHLRFCTNAAFYIYKNSAVLSKFKKPNKGESNILTSAQTTRAWERSPVHQTDQVIGNLHSQQIFIQKILPGFVVRTFVLFVLTEAQLHA